MKNGQLFKLLPILFCCVLCACAPRTMTPDSTEQNRIMAEAMEAYGNGDCRKSIDLFSILAHTAPHAAVFNGLGMAQLQCGQNIQAIGNFKKAVNLSPASSALHANLGSAYFAAGNFGAAGNEFETALRNDPANPEALMGKVGVMLEKGDADKALVLLKQLPPQSQQTPEALFDRALILYKLGVYDDAEQAINQCIDKNGGDAAVYNVLAITQLGLKRYREALDSIDRAISQDPMEGRYYYNRGNIRRAMKEFPRAIEDYGRAIAYNPEFAEAFVNRGDLLFLEKNQREGCKDLEEACRLGLCDRLESFREMGRCLTGMWK